jgi:glucan phosphoethanolaminetransferase (alkaline phosphatase superfamily)
MSRFTLSRLILTVVLVGGSVMSFLLDWSQNHLLNSLWHPHARFHAAILLFLFAGVAGCSTWLLWRRSAEPEVAITVAALLSTSYWAPFFFVPLLLPGSSWWAGVPGHEPRVHGAVIYPNLIVVGLFLAATIAAWWMGTRPRERRTA